MTDRWILTYTGRQFWPFNPRPEDICIEDIAHALSCLCRFGGHTTEFYSVAQHSVLASLCVHPSYKLEALLHDASEAYLVDVPRPIKQHPDMLVYREAERAVEGVIIAAFGLNPEATYNVRDTDELLLRAERQQLMPPSEHWPDRLQILRLTIEPWTPQQAETAFLDRLAEVSR